MSNLNDKLMKSLEEIEALADEILSKSEETEVVAEDATAAVEGAGEAQESVEDGKGEEVEKGLKPEEVSDDTPNDESKADDEDAKDDKGDEEDNEEDAQDDKGDVKKSFVEMAQENEELAKGIEVSDFLSEFTRLHGAIVDSLREDVAKSLQTSAQTATILAKSFNAIMKSQNQLFKSIKELAERLDAVERQPVGRKAVVNVMEKSFNRSAGVTEPTQELSKSQKLAKLTDLALQGNHGVTIQDVIHFESTGQLRPELESLFKTN